MDLSKIDDGPNPEAFYQCDGSEDPYARKECLVAMNHQSISDDSVMAELCALGDLCRWDAAAVVQQQGIEALRAKVRAIVYARTPMTSADAAARVGLRNRGLLLRYLDENQIPPAPETDDDSETAQREFNRRMAERLSCLR